MSYRNNPQDKNVREVLEKAYTHPFPLLYYGMLLVYALFDLSSKGNHHLARAFGIESDFWIIICVIASILAGGMSVIMVSLMYTRYSGKLYLEDRLAFVKAGGQDINLWSGVLANLITLFAFARWVPVGWAGWFRPIALLIGIIVIGNTLAFFASHLVFSRLFRRPKW